MSGSLPVCIWAPGGALVSAPQGAAIGARALAAQISTPAELQRRLLLPDDDPDALRVDALRALLERLGDESRLLLVATDQPPTIDERLRDGDTVDLARLVAALLREPPSPETGLPRTWAQVVPIAVDVSDLGACTAALSAQPVIQRALTGSPDVAVARGAGPAPLQLALQATVAALRPRPARLVQIGRNPADRVSYAEDVDLTFPVTNARGLQIVSQYANTLFTRPSAGPARATLWAIVDRARTGGTEHLDELEECAQVTELAWRLDQAPTIASERHRAADEVQTRFPEGAGTAFAAAIRESPDGFLPVRAHRALRHQQGPITAFESNRIALRLSAPELELAEDQVADAAWLEQVRQRAPHDQQDILGQDVVADLMLQAKHQLPTLPGAAAGGRAVGLLVFAEALGQGDLEPVRKLLAASAAGGVTLDELLVVGTLQRDTQPGDTAKRAAELANEIDRSGSDGLRPGAPVRSLVLHGSPASLVDVIVGLSTALGPGLQRGDQLVVLQHGGAPALSHGAMLYALQRGVDLRLWRPLDRTRPEPVEVPIAATLNALAQTATLRAVASGFADRRDALGMLQFLTACVPSLTEAARAIIDVDEGPPDGAPAVDPASGESWTRVNARWARARAELIGSRPGYRGGRPDFGLWLAERLLLDTANGDQAAVNAVLGDQWLECRAAWAASAGTTSRTTAIEAVTGRWAASTPPNALTVRSLDKAMTNRLRALGDEQTHLQHADPVAGALHALAARIGAEPGSG